ncbi:MAG: 4Fe-4S binding protein [Planctomycetes bacterium]|nr:4Fe-4S binding protein [Planctomycetota bacterium]
MRPNLFRRHNGASGRLGRILKVLGPTWVGSPIRRLAQVFCLLSFLVLFFYVCWPYGARQYAEAFHAKEIVTAELFLLLDPLVSISAALAGKMLLGALMAAAAAILVCVLFPRAFCGYVCPLGTLLDGFDWLIGRRVTRWQLEREGWWANLRYFLLTAVLVAAVFGVLLSGFCAAIPVLTRAMLLILAPAQTGLLKGWYLVPPMNFGHWLSILLVVLIFGLGFGGRRFWCRYVCPTGALFSVCNGLRLSERRVTAACVKCGQCRKICSFAAINEDFSTRFRNCTFCQSCAGVCPAGAIEFTSRWNRNKDVRPAPQACAQSLLSGWQPEAPLGEGLPRKRGSADDRSPTIPKTFGLEAAARFHAPSKSDISRRGILAGLGAASVVGASASLGVGSQRGEPPIRPPGSVPEDKFLQLCIRCGQCIKVCPNNVLQPAGFEYGLNDLWTPHVVADWSGCEPSCSNCGQVCPTGAIRALTLEEKQAARIGLAQVDQRTCLPYAGRGACQLCVDECRMAGYNAIEFLRVGGAANEKGEPVEDSGRLAPAVREDRCVGCGLCQMRCHAINVKTQKLLQSSAIRVAAGGDREDRMLRGSYLALRKERARRKQDEEKMRSTRNNAGSEYLPDFLK